MVPPTERHPYMQTVEQFAPQQPAAKTSQTQWNKYNPATGECLGQYENPRPEIVEAQLALAHHAQSAWASHSLKFRTKVLKKVGELLLQRADVLALTISQEVGKPLAEAYQSDLLSASIALNHAIQQGHTVFKPRSCNWHRGLLFGRTFLQRPVPKGVIAVISPWNYPVGTPMSGLAGAFLAGNAIIFKPSEKTPATGAALAQLFFDALRYYNLSTDCFQLIQGTGVVGKQVVESAIVNAVFFTGSEPVGRWIQGECARQNKPCTLELGGSDPLIILPSAASMDLDAIVSFAVWGRFSNAGQTCAAVKRLLVPKTLAQQVQTLLIAKVKQLRVGNPLQTETHMGPMIDTTQLAMLQAQLADAKAVGGTIFQQEGVPKNLVAHQAFFAPTVVWDLPPHANVLTQEVFGSILPIVVYETVAEAIAHCNALPFGLTANLFGEPLEANQVSQQLQYAHIGINDVAMCHYPLAALPWHGWKASGPGVRNGSEGLLQFVEMQLVGETAGFTWMPWLRKAPWLFSKGATSTQGAKALLMGMGGTSASLCQFPSWGLLQSMWRNRANQKL
jgi:acyl-CoA reductase-like NAD-dependent aldehyde dehydrogenase